MTLLDTDWKRSELPVIVSLEVHCSKEQQEIMVEIINEMWAQYLVRPSAEECKRLPSPIDLKRKILVKVKYVPPEAVIKKATKSTAPVQLKRSKSSSSSLSENQDITVGEEKKKGSAIIAALSALGVYTRSYHFKSLDTPESSVPTHIFSLSESKFAEVHGKEPDSLLDHNRNFLMRAFPSGRRIASSNLDPSSFWRRGVQIVALNWQKYDKGMMLNQAMFADSAGWILKPNGFRGQSSENLDSSPYQAQENQSLTISVTIFAGQNIPLPLGDTKSTDFHPYVKCELHIERFEQPTIVGPRVEAKKNSCGDKETSYKQKTNIAKGCNPDFKAEKLDFPTTNCVIQNLSFLR